MALLAWIPGIFLVGIIIFFSADDTSDVGTRGAGEIARGRYWSCQGPGLPNEALLGQRQTDGCFETCIYNAW